MSERTLTLDKSGLVTKESLDQNFVSHKILEKGYAELRSRLAFFDKSAATARTYVVKGFNPLFFFEEFPTAREAKKFFKKLH